MDVLNLICTIINAFLGVTCKQFYECVRKMENKLFVII